MTKIQSKLNKDNEYIREAALTPGEAIRTTLLNRVSWGAVFAGVATAFSVQLVLTLFGLGLGFATIDSYAASGVTAEEFSWGAGLWWVFTGILGALAGGFAAGRLSGEPKESTAGWHGFISWATCVLILGMFMTSATAGGLASMSGPFQVILDREVVSVDTNAPAQRDVVTRGITTDAPAVDSDTVATAALLSAIALVIGAAASWLGGFIGTVRADVASFRKERVITTVR